MSRIIVSFFIILFYPLISLAQQDITFTTSDKYFPVISTAIGEVSESGPFLSVVLEQYTMRIKKDYKFPVNVLKYKVGIAFQTQNGGWDIARWSDAVDENIVMLAGQTKLIKNYKAVIPIDGLPSLRGYWLVLAVESKINGTNGFTYAHSNKDIF